MYLHNDVADLILMPDLIYRLDDLLLGDDHRIKGPDGARAEDIALRDCNTVAFQERHPAGEIPADAFDIMLSDPGEIALHISEYPLAVVLFSGEGSYQHQDTDAERGQEHYQRGEKLPVKAVAAEYHRNICDKQRKTDDPVGHRKDIKQSEISHPVKDFAEAEAPAVGRVILILVQLFSEYRIAHALPPLSSIL